MPSKHWSVRPSGDLCRLRSTTTPSCRSLVEIAHTDEDGIVHEQTVIAARSMTETFLNRLSIADRCPLSPHKRRKSEHFLTAASCHNRTKCIAAKNSAYSITSSAMLSSVGGTVRPSILAVWALMTSSILLDCTTGKSAGLVPLRMRPV